MNSVKSNQSIRILLSFSLSFLMTIVFAIGYIFSAELVALSVEESGGLFAVWGPPALISLVCTVLCCLLMLVLKDKILIPLAFVFLLVYCLCNWPASADVGSGA